MSDEQEQHASECFCMGAGPTFTKFAKAFGPPEAAASHFRQARIEFLKGLRELIDDRIGTLSQTREPKGTKVVVE